MDLLRLIEARLGRWMAYADSCVHAETELARCQGFWAFVSIVLGIICAAAIAVVTVKIILGRRRRQPAGGKGRYDRP